MKLQEISFPRPVKVLQVFRDIYHYGKDEKSFEQRKEELVWKEMKSKSGYVMDGELFLPESILSAPEIRNCGLITLEDNNHPMKNSGSQYWFRESEGAGKLKAINRYFNYARHYRLEFIEVRNNAELELFLKWGYFEVGDPEREDHKLCVLRQNSPVEIKINGKTDFSMSSRRARQFEDQQYIFEYLGEFNKCRILREPYEPVIKHVPEERKVVDLTKQLW